jgi:PEP-CTERM motif
MLWKVACLKRRVRESTPKVFVVQSSHEGNQLPQCVRVIAGITLRGGEKYLCNGQDSGGFIEVNGAAVLFQTGSLTPTPEPSTLALFGTGILGLAGVARRKFLA